VPVWLLGLLAGLLLVLDCGLGLFVVLLARPKDRTADAIAGLMTGLVAAVTAFLVSVGWMAVLLTTVLPAREEVQLLSEAAWAEPGAAPGGAAPAERLLDKYPALRDVPAAERGRLFADKVLADLAAGVPLGLWLGALFCLVPTVVFVTGQTVVAGALLRRSGHVRGMIVRYAELSVLVVLLGAGTIRRLAGIVLGGGDVPMAAYLLLCGLMLLALVGALRGWPWPLRLVLHAAWVAAALLGKYYGAYYHLPSL
jgi:hypothetical protein